MLRGIAHGLDVYVEDGGGYAEHVDDHGELVDAHATVLVIADARAHHYACDDWSMRARCSLDPRLMLVCL